MQAAEEQAREHQEKFRCAKGDITRLRAELEQAEKSAKRTEVSSREESKELGSQLEAARHELQDVCAELEERTTQLSVLTDTVEALQVGSISERDQRIVNLTAQLMAVRLKESASSCRAAANAKASARDRARLVEAEQRRDSATAECKALEGAAAVLRQQCESLSTEAAEAKAALKGADSERQKLLDAADRAASRQAVAESEVAGLQAALQKAASRHAEQLVKERATVRSGREQELLGGSPAEPKYLARIREQLGALITGALQGADGTGVTARHWSCNLCCRLASLQYAVVLSAFERCWKCALGPSGVTSVFSFALSEKATRDQSACPCHARWLCACVVYYSSHSKSAFKTSRNGGLVGFCRSLFCTRACGMVSLPPFERSIPSCWKGSVRCAGADGWHVVVCKKLQDMMLEAEAERSRAVTDARIAREDLAVVESRLRVTELSREQAMQSADAAAAQVAAMSANMETSHELAMRHQVERLALQSKRISVLQEQLQHVNARLCEAVAAQHAATEAAQAQATTAAELSHALRTTQTQLECVSAQRDGLQLELTGTNEGSGLDRAAAVAARDAGIKEFLSSRILPLLQYGCALTTSCPVVWVLCAFCW
jgi:chemotaxis protein histidine kinase CheA